MADSVPQITFSRTCPHCSKQHFFTVPQADYDRWQGGALIQRVFPRLSIDTRETMISGYCPKCWDAAFGESEL